MAVKEKKDSVTREKELVLKKKRKEKKAEYKGKKRGPKERPIDLDLVEKCAAQFQTTEEMAHNLGYSQSYFFTLRDKYPEIEERIQAGRNKARTILKGRYWSLIEEGNVQCTLFGLKVHCGWKEQSDKAIEEKIDQAVDKIQKNIELWNLRAAPDKI